MNAHPAAELFPMLPDEDLDLLALDIKARGLVEPILTFEGQILDGRNRFKACEQIGRKPTFTEYTGDDPVGEIVSRNLRRRHLNASQRAMVAARLADRPWGRPRLDAEGVTQPEAAQMMNVSLRTVRHARKVLESKNPHAIAAADAGAVAVSTLAEQILKSSPTVQADILRHADPKTVDRLSKERREERKAQRQAKKVERLNELEEQATAAAPDFTGIDLRHADLYETFEDARGCALVHADPPWTYNNQGNGGATETYEGNVKLLHDVISDLNNAWDYAADDAVMLVWITNPFLIPFGMEIARRQAADAEFGGDHRSWRWEYKSAGTWAKTGNIGIGHWWRGHSETILLFVKGHPVPRQTIRNLHISEKTEHSEKPVPFLREMLETFCPPGGLVLDLFAGMAPMARACRAEERRYIGAELDEIRFRQAMLKLSVFKSAS